jgi:hypothetical protein
LLAEAGAPTLSPEVAIAAMVGVTVAIIHELPVTLSLSKSAIHAQTPEVPTKPAVTPSYDVTKETLAAKNLREF